METQFNNLEEIQIFMWDLIRNTKCKEIKKIDSELILEFMVASQKFIENEILNYAEILGYKNTHPNLRVKVYKPYIASWRGRCDFYNLIEINLLDVIKYKLWSIRKTMIHELCHLSIRGHTIDFFELEFNSLKKVGLLNKDTTFLEAYYPPDNRGFYHFRNSGIYPLFVCNYNNNCSKLDNLFRHKVFDLKLRYCNYRFIRKEYKNKMKDLCDLYLTDINKFNFSW